MDLYDLRAEIERQAISDSARILQQTPEKNEYLEGFREGYIAAREDACITIDVILVSHPLTSVFTVLKCYLQSQQQRIYDNLKTAAAKDDRTRGFWKAYTELYEDVCLSLDAMRDDSAL